MITSRFVNLKLSKGMHVKKKSFPNYKSYCHRTLEK